MSALRQFGVVTKCFRCQRHAINGFLSIAGLSVPPIPLRARPLHNRSQFRRQYSEKASFVSRVPPDDGVSQFENATGQEQLEEPIKQEEIAVVEQEPPSEAISGEIQEEQASDDIPWYLQEEEAEYTAEPSFSDRQKLPEIPDDAPERLPEILQRLSIDIGLDHLRLIDLRKLDPPPALGAGVLMIIGTARSEKHLHVSGDRFARWLRSAYKLTPRADGLLGRNELKLKLKRKAKRARLLSSVGATPNPNEDDGTRTGWICVDAGVIEQVTAMERSLDDSGIIGFGGQADGVKLVVQMMTEEKRRELDLETLWERTLARQERARAAVEAAEESGEEQDDGAIETDADSIDMLQQSSNATPRLSISM